MVKHTWKSSSICCNIFSVCWIILWALGVHSKIIYIIPFSKNKAKFLDDVSEIKNSLSKNNKETIIDLHQHFCKLSNVFQSHLSQNVIRYSKSIKSFQNDSKTVSFWGKRIFILKNINKFCMWLWYWLCELNYREILKGYWKLHGICALANSKLPLYCSVVNKNISTEAVVRRCSLK